MESKRSTNEHIGGLSDVGVSLQGGYSSDACNLGPDGWKLGRVIALHYREMDWPTNMVAPYQVVLEADQMLIYVPEDDAIITVERRPARI